MSFEDMKQLVTPNYIPNYITDNEEKELLNITKIKEWNTSIERRTLHWGYEYNYTLKNKLMETEYDTC